MFTVLERVERLFSDFRLHLYTRDYLTGTLKNRVSHPINSQDKIDDDILLINGAINIDEKIVKVLREKLDKNVVMQQTEKKRLIFAKLGENVFKKYEHIFAKPLTNSNLKVISKGCRLLKADSFPLMNYPWDLVDNCADIIRKDYQTLAEKESKGIMDEKAVVYGEKSDVFIGEGSFVEAFVALDARNGPIYIGDRTVVKSGSNITGPAYIGNDTIISSALIREGSSIGNVCRIGGEFEQTIVQGYTNKQHLGYFGHSYIGEWVNIGAATTNSNLKNTYGKVKVTTSGEQVGHIKMGCFIGDHVKTSIGTQIYTGQKIGVASQVHGFVVEDVPAFTLWAKSLGAKLVELRLKSAIETQKRVFARRNVKQTKEDIELLKKIFILTAQERKKAKITKGKFRL
jgi:UDP-N-acetylglucosamine diphosphorylase/glucosamine-1-phosphate N-acetyltransferase